MIEAIAIVEAIAIGILLIVLRGRRRKAWRETDQRRKAFRENVLSGKGYFQPPETAGPKAKHPPKSGSSETPPPVPRITISHRCFGCAADAITEDILKAERPREWPT